jgi:hypothetical protein
VDVSTGGSECSLCGRPLSEHDQHFRFTLPDPVLDTSDREAAAGTWMSSDDPRSSVMMQVPGIGSFVRALLPVSLTGGFAVTFGVWLAVHPQELQRIFSVWWEPEYAQLSFDGRLANAIPPWGLLAAPATAVVRDAEETPYCAASENRELARVLTEQWPHDVVLGAIRDRQRERK